MSNFKLPNKTIKVKFIRRKTGMAQNVDDSHVIAGGMLNGSFKKIFVPLTKQNQLANVLTKEEKDFLEGSDGLNLDLSVYSNKEFWLNRYVRLRKGDNYLDLSDPIDYISAAILKANKNLIAPNWKARNERLEYIYAIVEDGEESQIKRNDFSFKKKAIKQYMKIETNSEILRSVIKLIDGKVIAKTASLDFLQEMVELVIDTKPEAFVNLMEDADFETKILISTSEDLGIIVKQGNKYATSDGLELCRKGELPTFTNAVAYLTDPLNKEVVDIIESKINKLQKKSK
jgi:hypothetical protein